jgi:hypothetical protein
MQKKSSDSITSASAAQAAKPVQAKPKRDRLIWQARRQKLVGQKRNKLTLLNSFVQNGKTIWRCRCKCRTLKEVPQAHVLSGHTKSCGCWRKKSNKLNGKQNRKHGMSDTPTYHSWSSMLARCARYPGYADRGIIVCKRWQTFENFLADMGRRPAGTTLGRRNNDGNYAPGNCRWETSVQQLRNTRQNRRITFDGRTLCLAAWSALTGTSRSTLYYRLKHHLPLIPAA